MDEYIDLNRAVTFQIRSDRQSADDKANGNPLLNISMQNINK